MDQGTSIQASAGTGQLGGIEDFRRTQEKYTKHRRSRGDLAIAIMLAAFIAILAASSLIAPDSGFSQNENRSLSAWPQISFEALADGSYASQLQSYVADQFIGRDSWITLKLDEDKARGVRESNGVYLGSDGYLIDKAAATNPDGLDASIASINSFAQRYSGLSYSMAVIPNAVCVLSDHLPANAPAGDQRAQLGAISAALDDKVQFIDVADALYAHKDEDIYYRTDHHWTSLGAYYAFDAMAAGLGIDAPVADYDIHVVSDSFEGTMASKSGSYETKDSIEVYTPKDPGSEFYVTYEDTHEKSLSLYRSDALQGKDQYAVFLGGNHPRITIRSTNNNGRCLLIFKDSYANCFVQFLTPYYEEIVIIDPRYYYEDVGTVITTEGVTDVLFLYNLNTYLGDTSLCDVLDAAGSTR